MANAPTIIALSSGHVPSGVAVIRVSGPRARFATETIAGSVPPTRQMGLRTLEDWRDGSVLDQALVVFFQGPASFTGEDIAEFHCHGGRAVVDGVISALLSSYWFALAEAGDFTRQAFTNGKLDLTQVEALGDLIDASTADQRALALAQMSGSASAKVINWSDRLIDLRASIEADLDFSDEDDVPGSVVDSLPEQIQLLLDEWKMDLSDRFSERLREGFRVVLAGAPNSGKSTLLNALLDREAALVSPIAGTTRDQIDVPIDMGGLPVILSDTAGLRSKTDDQIELMGMERTASAIENADCVVWLENDEAQADQDVLGNQSFHQSRSNAWVRIRSKSDLNLGDPDSDGLNVSGKTGEGLTALKSAIADVLKDKGEQANLATVSLDVRRRTALERAAQHLSQALIGLGHSVPALDHVAEDLRLAQNSLGQITGDVGAEDILDALFYRFCIGK